MGFKSEVIAKLDKLSDKQNEHTTELAKYNIILTEHHVRASQLESRIKPIEKHVIIINGLVKISGALVATAAALAAIYHYLVK